MIQNIVENSAELHTSPVYDCQLGQNVEDSEGFRCTIGFSECDDQDALLKVVLNSHENYTMSNAIEDSDIVWFGRPFVKSDVEMLPKIKGFLNRIYGTELFKDKDTQALILNQCKELFPEEFSFHPGSFCLMKEYDLLQKEVMKTAPNRLWIAKPSDGGDGDGIFLFKTMEELHNIGLTDDMVVQQYIGNPLLLRKKKWDARVYVMVHGINPMRGYISTDCGLGRFCTEDYDTSDTGNIFSHLTNYSINRKSDKYVNNDDENVSEDQAEKTPTKVSLEHVWRMMKEEYPHIDIAELKQKVINISANVLRSCRSSVEVKCAEIMNMHMPPEVNDKFFHVLGLDIMFDDNFDAWLFETNRFPSMDIYFNHENSEGVNIRERSVIDEKIKGTILHESFKILVGKQESDIFTKFYDTSELGSLDADFIYEKVFQVYKKLCGGDIKPALTVADFYNITNVLPFSVNSSEIDVEGLIHRLQLQDSASIGIIDLFNALKFLHEDGILLFSTIESLNL